MTMNTYELIPETHVPERNHGHRAKSIRSATMDRFVESDMEIASVEFATVNEATLAAACMSKYATLADLPVKVQRRKCKIYLSKIH